jgi:hypothetical protein
MRSREHGKAERTVVTDHSEVERRLAQAADSGVELSTVTAELERDASLCDSYRQLLDRIQTEHGEIAA